MNLDKILAAGLVIIVLIIIGVINSKFRSKNKLKQ